VEPGEGIFTLGFLLLGLAPLFITIGVGVAAGIFVVGLIFSTSAAFS
jgi:hypothetical protein